MVARGSHLSSLGALIKQSKPDATAATREKKEKKSGGVSIGRNNSSRAKRAEREEGIKGRVKKKRLGETLAGAHGKWYSSGVVSPIMAGAAHRMNINEPE